MLTLQLTVCHNNFVDAVTNSAPFRQPFVSIISIQQIVFDDNSSDAIDRLEHVQVIVTLHNHRRGDLAIYLTSPMGTTSELLKRRLVLKL